MATSVREVSSLFKIARWVAVGGGLSYGYIHARTLRNEANQKRVEQEYERKVALIQEAKKKFAES
ncbi:hypothetical protein H4R99_006673, partial [Coemansia sp. RSA 1722]